MKFFIKPEIRYMLEHIDEVPVTEERYFIITSKQEQYLKKLIRRIDKLGSEKLDTLTTVEKLQYSCYLVNAERLIKQGRIVN